MVNGEQTKNRLLPFTIYHLPFTILKMSVRHPPENRVPPVARRGGKQTRRPPRIVKYEEPPQSFWRRWRKRIFHPYVLIALVFFTTICIGILGYYWHIFSKRIDILLQGEIFTRSAGIYAAPKTLRRCKSSPSHTGWKLSGWCPPTA